MHQTCHFRKRATSAPAEGPLYGPNYRETLRISPRSSAGAEVACSRKSHVRCRLTHMHARARAAPRAPTAAPPIIMTIIMIKIMMIIVVIVIVVLIVVDIFIIVILIVIIVVNSTRARAAPRRVAPPSCSQSRHIISYHSIIHSVM